MSLIDSLSKVKNFDVISQKDEGKQTETKQATTVKIPTRRRCKYYSKSHKLR